MQLLTQLRALRAPHGVQRAAALAQLTLLVCGAELLLVLLGNWSWIASVWELQWGSVWLAPSALLGVGAALGLCWLLVETTLRHRHGRYWACLGLVLFALAVAWGVTHGRHFELWWRRAGFMGVAALGAGWLAYRYSPTLRTVSERYPQTVTYVALALALVVEAANRWLLVRLYPALHAGWAALSLLLVALAFVVQRQRAQRAGGAVGSGLSSWCWASCWLGAALLVLPALQHFARFDNFRLLLTERAPILGEVVRLASRWVPPPPLAVTQVAQPKQSQVHAGVSFAQRDILFVTIDAARADHFGAYGYTRPTTPHADELAAQGVRFERAYAPTPHTSYSVVSLMTGKYIRPLLLQGAGQGSETLAQLLRSYGYRTAAFFPPAVFFIDPARFAPFEESGLGFEYQKKEFLEGEPRVQQVVQYLDSQPESQRVFTWVHLFGPHEPYEHHPEYDFGGRDIDRYDSELRAADHTLGRLVREFRARRPNAIVLVSADHGEEFGEHGGRYHGSSVYEEQVRVPLILSAPGLVSPRVVTPPVQTIDLLPTLLRALDIPIRPRVRGRDLTPFLGPEPLAPSSSNGSGELGFAYAETEEQSMLAEGSLRLVCERKVGACRLFDLQADPVQQRDAAGQRPSDVERLRAQLQNLNATHGQFEQQGLRAEGLGWPAAILRGLTGDGDAAADIAELLDDADVAIRRKASETLFRLRREETAASLQLALQRDEDNEVRRYAALTLTRLGHGASLSVELLSDPDLHWRRRAALALGEAGDRRGESELIAWWMSGERDHEQSLELLQAFQKLRTDDVVWALLRSLSDVRLRPHIAKTLAVIGDQDARGALAQALNEEPYQTARVALAQALLALDADTELVLPLRRWLGVADPLQGGLGMATRAGILEHVGGPDEGDLRRLRENATLGELVRVIIPKTGNGAGVRVLIRATHRGTEPAAVWVGLPKGMFSYDEEGKLKRARKVPEIHPERRVALRFTPAESAASAVPQELYQTLPADFDWKPGHAVYLVVLAERGIELESLALLPLQDELQPVKTER